MLFSTGKKVTENPKESCCFPNDILSLLKQSVKQVDQQKIWQNILCEKW